jgi:hypothetical protein
MLIPSILPDELAHGYQGRIQRVNMFTSPLDTASIIKRTFLKENEHDGIAERVLALARAAGMSLENFCQYHTLMPFLRAATQVHPNITHGAHDQLRLIKRSGLRLSVQQHMACPDCIKEDIDYHGFAYWRRRHQIVGVPWCDKHLVPLLDIGEEFDVSPSANQNSHHVAALKSFDSLIANPIINRYIEIVSGFLQRKRPLSFTEASMKVNRRAKEKGIRVAENGHRTNLSDIALNYLPISWISSIFPGIELKKSGAYFPVLDGAAFHTVTPQAHALALALLYDSAEEALEYWSSPLLDESSPFDEEADNGQNFWNSRKVFNAYVKSRGNRSEVGRVLSFHSRQVSWGLGRAGLPSLAKVDHETTGRALLAFYNGYPLHEACVMHRADHATCEELIRQAGARFSEALRRIMRVPVSNQDSQTVVAEQDEKTAPPSNVVDHIIKTWSPHKTAA